MPYCSKKNLYKNSAIRTDANNESNNNNRLLYIEVKTVFLKAKIKNIGIMLPKIIVNESFVGSACQKNFNALITSPYLVSMDKLNNRIIFHAILSPIATDAIFKKVFISFELSDFLL